MSALPANWTIAAGQDLFDQVRGVNYDKADERFEPGPGLVPLLRAQNIVDGNIDQRETNFVPRTNVDKHQLLRHGDVLIASSSGSRTVVGKAAMFDGPDEAYSFGAFCTCLRAKGVDARYLWFFTRGREYRDYVEAVALGTNINNFRSRDIDALSVPLPPEREQRRIVAKLDALSARSKRARAELDRVKALAERARQAVLANAVSGQYTSPTAKLRVLQEYLPPPFTGIAVPEHWRCLPLSKAAANFDGRRVPLKASDRVQRSGKYPYYGASGIIDHINGFIFEGNYLLVSEDGANLLTRNTPVAFTANGKFWVNNHAHVLGSNGACDLSYLSMYINSIDLTRYISGSAQPKLPQRTMNEIKVLVPPLEEQASISVIVEKAFLQIDRMAAEALTAGQLINRLDQSILSRAFRGELVPHDPSDEPASVLLDRIRADREAGGATSRRRRRTG